MAKPTLEKQAKPRDTHRSVNQESTTARVTLRHFTLQLRGSPRGFGGTREHGGICSGNTGTKQEYHREQGNTKYIGEQGNKAYFRERVRILS